MPYCRNDDTTRSGKDTSRQRIIKPLLIYSYCRCIRPIPACRSKDTGLTLDVIIVTGDHSTPSSLKFHSWHPVPFLLCSKYCRPDKVDFFSEQECMNGGFDPNFPAVDIMPVALPNAQRRNKFGAQGEARPNCMSTRLNETEAVYFWIDRYIHNYKEPNRVFYAFT